MDLSDKRALERGLETIRDALGLEIPAQIEAAFKQGEIVGILRNPQFSGLAALRFHLAASSYLWQPDVATYYNIFDAGRAVPLMRRLAEALPRVLNEVDGAKDRVERLASARTIESYESIIFEILVAERYAASGDFGPVKFLVESAEPKPDLETTWMGSPFGIECKKLDRTTEAATKTEEALNRLGLPLLAELHESGESVCIEMVITGEPVDLDAAEIRGAVFDSISSGGVVLCNGANIHASPIPLPDLVKFDVLVPGPQYFKDHFDYSPQSEWNGIMPFVGGEMSGPSFFTRVRWHAAIKWKFANDDVTWRYVRMNYKRLFKAIQQLDAYEGKSSIHLAFDRHPAIGNRAKSILRLLEELNSKERKLGWAVLNEFASDVSYGGRFDFSEIAHLITSPSVRMLRPPVTTIFTGDDDFKSGSGAFGYGAELPPIDDDHSM